MWRALLIVVGFLVAYVGVTSLLHFVVFPEPTPPPEDRPRSGTEVHLPGGWTFVYRQTALESSGAIFEADWLGEPGAGIPRLTHPSQEVRLEVVEGALRVVADGEERVLRPGDEIVIPAGVEHLWENASETSARGVFELRPAGMADFVFVQLDRAFGGKAGALSTAVQTIILIGTHGRHTAWPIKTLRFLVAPTARLFGYRSYYEPLASGESSLLGRRSVFGLESNPSLSSGDLRSTGNRIAPPNKALELTGRRPGACEASQPPAARVRWATRRAAVGRVR